MQHYNFDEVVDRWKTSCVKYDGMAEAYPGKEGLTPLWVADMDFKTPDFIVDALKARCEHPIFGYTFGDDAYYNSITSWLVYKYNWEIQREWLMAELYSGDCKRNRFCRTMFHPARR